MSDSKRLVILAVTYECMKGTELQDKQRETDMMLDIFKSIRDQDFRTETDTYQPLQYAGSCAKNRSSRAALVCLVLLCFLLTGVIVMGVYFYTNYTQERDQLLTRISNLTEKRDDLLIRNTNLTTERKELLTNFFHNTEERNELRTRIIELTEERNDLLTKNTNMAQLNRQLIEKTEQSKCFKDVFYYKSSLYYASTKSWTESRRDCREEGADLIVINDRQEIDFVKSMSGDAKFWIGLTDIEVEANWKWVDGTSMTFGFWGIDEPDGHRVENCAITEKYFWYDYPCEDYFTYICEKEVHV